MNEPVTFVSGTVGKKCLGDPLLENPPYMPGETCKPFCFCHFIFASFGHFHPWGISRSLNQNHLNVNPDRLRQNIIQLHLLLWLVYVCILPLALESRDRGLNHKTLCMNSEQILSNGKKVRHYDVHSLYGWSQTQPTYEWVHINLTRGRWQQKEHSSSPMSIFSNYSEEGEH